MREGVLAKERRGSVVQDLGVVSRKEIVGVEAGLELEGEGKKNEKGSSSKQQKFKIVYREMGSGDRQGVGAVGGSKKHCCEGGGEEIDGRYHKKVRKDISICFETNGPSVGGVVHPAQNNEYFILEFPRAGEPSCNSSPEVAH